MNRLDRARMLTYVLVALMAVQAALGLVFSGEYRDAAWIVATWWGNDWVTLLLGVPLLAAAPGFAKRAPVRGSVFWAGMLAYATYNYAYYLLGASLNRFFGLYVVCVLLAVTALVTLLTGVGTEAVAASLRSRARARAIGGYFIFVAIGLAVIWLGTWAAYAFAGRPTPVETDAFRLVAALDLTLMVPVLALGGVLLWRRGPWGFVVGGLAGVQASLYLFVLSVNSLVAIGRGLAEAPGELVTWVPLLVATAAATLALFASAEAS